SSKSAPFLECGKNPARTRRAPGAIPVVSSSPPGELPTYLHHSTKLVERDINELHIEPVFLKRAGLLSHPDTCHTGRDHGIRQAQRSGQYLSFATKPKQCNLPEQLFNAS